MTALASDRTSTPPSSGPVEGPVDDLGPDSLLWELLGDARNVLLIVHTGLLQALHPAIGSALTDQSTAFTDPWNRLWSSSHMILGTVYDAPEAGTSRTVRDFHRGVEGRTPGGESYHALNPGPFVWAHTTFVIALVAMREHFGAPLTPTQCEQLWAEGRQWYARYGLGLRELPADWAAATAYVHRTIEQDLTHVVSGALAIRSVTVPAASPFPSVPRPVWSRLGPQVGRLETWVATATLPPLLRDRLCLTWTRRDAAAFAVVRRVVRLTAAVVPHDRRYLPRARAGWQRETLGQ